MDQALLIQWFFLLAIDLLYYEEGRSKLIMLLGFLRSLREEAPAFLIT